MEATTPTSSLYGGNMVPLRLRDNRPGGSRIGNTKTYRLAKVEFVGGLRSEVALDVVTAKLMLVDRSGRFDFLECKLVYDEEGHAGSTEGDADRPRFIRAGTANTYLQTRRIAQITLADEFFESDEIVRGDG